MRNLNYIVSIGLCLLVMGLTLGSGVMQPVSGVVISKVDKSPVVLAKSQIKFTYVPKYGSFKNLNGKVVNANPKKYRIAVYIYVNGGWWTKPYKNKPTTIIKPNGKWSCDITTGGYDQKATIIRAYLIPAKYKPPLALGSSDVPLSINKHAVAWVQKVRKH